MKTVIIILFAICIYLYNRLYSLKKALKKSEDYIREELETGHRKNENIHCDYLRSIQGICHDLEQKVEEVKRHNPFHPDTRIQVFSSNLEANTWFDNNCEECCHAGTCKAFASFTLSSGNYYDTLPLSEAKKVGLRYNALQCRGQLNDRCAMFADPNETGELETFNEKEERL